MGNGTVEGGTGGVSTRFIKEDWPITEGLTAGTTKTHGRKVVLEPEGIDGKKSNVKEKDRELI